MRCLGQAIGKYQSSVYPTSNYMSVQSFFGPWLTSKGAHAPFGYRNDPNIGRLRIWTSALQMRSCGILCWLQSHCIGSETARGFESPWEEAEEQGVCWRELGRCCGIGDIYTQHGAQRRFQEIRIRGWDCRRTKKWRQGRIRPRLQSLDGRGDWGTTSSNQWEGLVGW